MENNIKTDSKNMSYEDVSWIELDRDRAPFRILWWRWQNFGSYNNRLSFSWWRKILYCSFSMNGKPKRASVTMKLLYCFQHSACSQDFLFHYACRSNARSIGSTIARDIISYTVGGKVIPVKSWKKSPSILLQILAVDRSRWTASLSDCLLR